MGKESMEEGLADTTRPLLLGERKAIDSSKPKGDSAITPVLFLSSVVALWGYFCFGLVAGYSSTAEFGMMEDLGMSIAAYSVFGSIMTIGAAIGATLSGKIADLVGRKRTMGLSQIFYVLGWLGIAFAKNAWWVDIGRLSTGFAAGLNTYVVPIYIAEIAPKNIRGRFIAANHLMNCSGILVLYFIGNFLSWRTLPLLAIIPCLLQVIGLFFVPESPRWLASIGNKEEFKGALQCLRGVKEDISQEAIEIEDAIENFQGSQEARFLDLFQRKYAHRILIGVGLMLLQQLVGNTAMGTYLSTIFAKANFSATIGPTTIAFLQMPAAILGVFLMDTYGRRTLLVVSCVASCLCMSTIGLSFYLQEHHYAKELTPLLVFIGILGVGYAFAIGISGIPWVIMSEIFPLNVKASAGSLVNLVSWSSSWFMIYAFNFMLQWSLAGTFFFFASMYVVTLLFVWILVPETKGRSLEEIQAALIAPVPGEI